jgi:hypothetical protein
MGAKFSPALSSLYGVQNTFLLGGREWLERSGMI